MTLKSLLFNLITKFANHHSGKDVEGFSTSWPQGYMYIEGISTYKTTVDELAKEVGTTPLKVLEGLRELGRLEYLDFEEDLLNDNRLSIRLSDRGYSMVVQGLSFQ